MVNVWRVNTPLFKPSVAPGARITSAAGFRPFSGNSTMGVCEITWPMAPFVVLMVSAVPETSTDWLTSPTVRAKSTVAF